MCTPLPLFSSTEHFCRLALILAILLPLSVQTFENVAPPVHTDGQAVPVTRPVGTNVACSIRNSSLDTIDQKEIRMDSQKSERGGLIKYAIAWVLGVPLSLLIIIFLLARGC